MSFTLNAKDYVAYLRKTADHIGAQGDYITGLDAATGDGDHWINMNMGLQALLKKAEKLEGMTLSDCFREIGMTYMSVVGGSSGVLYGGAYLAAAGAVAGQEQADAADLGRIISAMAQDMIDRGNTKPGYKTMIDSIWPAAEAFRQGLEAGMPDRSLLEQVKKAALDGAEATKAMEAVRGRASYQTDKGVGHLDPGAVTMSYQLSDLCDYLLENRVTE